MKKTSKKYSGLRYRGRNRKGEHIYQGSFYLKVGGRREWITIKLRERSDREAFVLFQEAIVKRRREGEKKAEAVEGQQYSFKELMQELVYDMKSDRCRKKTINRALATYKTFFFRFLPKKFKHITSLEQLTTGVFNEYKKHIVNDLNRADGLRSELSTLKAIISRFTQAEFCSDEVKKALSQIKKPPAREKKYEEITKTEKVTLLNFVKQDKPIYYGPLYFMVRMGWRINETLSVKRKNVRTNGFQPVSITIESEDRKNKRSFTMSVIDEELAGVIMSYLWGGNKTQWLFPSNTKKRISDNHFRDYLARVSQRVLGRRLTPHMFRHSFVTEVVNARIPYKDAMAISGHKDIDVFLKSYSHATEEGIAKVMSERKMFS